MWDERYSEAGFAYGTEPNDFLATVAGRIPCGRVLTLAEGEGRNAVYLASLGHEVVAVDASVVGLEKASRLAADHGVRITTVVADLGDYRIEPESWDAIVSCYCHLPPAIRAPLHAAVVQGLKPGGLFVLEGFCKEQLAFSTGGPLSLDLLMSIDELKRELVGLEFSHAVEMKRDVREGRYHTGLAAVVQLLGVKPLKP